jgi:hypothetical protein
VAALAASLSPPPSVSHMSHYHLRQFLQDCPPAPTCAAWQDAENVMSLLGLHAAYFEPRFHRCFCLSCEKALPRSSRAGPLTMQRGGQHGQPPAPFSYPVGWCRFGMLFIAHFFRQLNPDVFNDFFATRFFFSLQY